MHIHVHIHARMLRTCALPYQPKLRSIWKNSMVCALCGEWITHQYLRWNKNSTHTLCFVDGIRIPDTMLWLSYDGWFFVCQDCQYKSHVALRATVDTELWRPRCWICHCHRMAALLDLRAAVDTDESLPGDRCQTHCSIPDYSELG